MIGEFFIIKKQFGKYMRQVLASGEDKILDIGCGKNPIITDS